MFEILIAGQDMDTTRTSVMLGGSSERCPSEAHRPSALMLASDMARKIGAMAWTVAH